MAAENGHLEIMRYLCELYKIDSNYTKIDIHTNNEEAFRWASQKGYLEIMRYLTNLYKVDPNYSRINT